MLKLNAGFSRKIGEPNYGSRGASVNVELELDSNLIRDPDAFCAQIRNLFDLARRSVDEELTADSGACGQTQPTNRNPSTGSDRGNGRTTNSRGNGDTSVRHATHSQLRTIRAICHSQQRDPEQLANERFHVSGIEELTLPEASSLIDELKSPAGNGNQKGGSR